MIKIARAIALITCLGAIVAMAVPASASQRVDNRTVRFGSCRSSGEFAACSASGSVNHPIRIKVHVKASPNQRVSGDWAMTCTRGTSVGSTSGTVSGLTPRVKELRMPFANPDSCSVDATVGLDNGGSIFVYLTARVP